MVSSQDGQPAEGESKGGAPSERTPFSSATLAQDAAGQEAGVRCAPVKTNRANTSDSRRKDRGPPPRDRGAPTQGTVGAIPRTGRAPTQGLAFRFLTRYF